MHWDVSCSDSYLPGDSVDVELHHVLPTGVVLRLPSSVLREDDAGNTQAQSHSGCCKIHLYSLYLSLPQMCIYYVVVIGCEKQEVIGRKE